MYKDFLILESALKMPIMQLPIKMTLIRLSTGVVLISPLPKIKKFKSEIDQFGTVTDIVAPNLYHNLGIKYAQEEFPQARMWGVEGYRQKMPEINWYGIITPDSWIHQEELTVVPVKGMPKMNEASFIHRSSKTLIVTDLCFNHIQGKGVGYWIIFKLFGTYKKFAVSKLFLSLVKDKVQFTQSIKKLMEMDFENIIIPHGENIIGGGRDRLKAAFAERKIHLV